MNILYLEYEPQDAELLALYTRAMTYNLTVASSLEEANAAIAEYPDLVLVDVMLGRTRDGFKFTQGLREQGFDRPVVAVTALATAGDMEECRRAGFDRVLTKPYTINQLAE